MLAACCACAVQPDMSMQPICLDIQHLQRSAEKGTSAPGPSHQDAVSFLGVNTLKTLTFSLVGCPPVAAPVLDCTSLLGVAETTAEPISSTYLGFRV